MTQDLRLHFSNNLFIDNNITHQLRPNFKLQNTLLAVKTIITSLRKYIKNHIKWLKPISFSVF